MGNTLTDISGRPLPTRKLASGAQRVIAVPPIRDVPSRDAIEVFTTGYALLPTGGGIVPLRDPTTGTGTFTWAVPDGFLGRVDYFLVECPDLVAAVSPYLFWSLRVNIANANAWGVVVAGQGTQPLSQFFDAQLDLGPNSALSLLANNFDAVNTHLFAIGIHGWQWPITSIEG